MKHITEATDQAFLNWLQDQPLPMAGDRFSLPKIEVLLRSAWNAALSSPQPPEGVAELVAEADEWVQEENWESSYETDGFNRPGTDLIVKLRNALTALSSVPVVTPSDEELLAAYTETREAFFMRRLNSNAPWGARDLEAHLAGLRAVAALSSAEGTKR